MRGAFDLEDYLNAVADAGKRTRTVIFFLLIGSVIAFACRLNSLDSNWMAAPVDNLARPGSEYSRTKLKMDPTAKDPLD